LTWMFIVDYLVDRCCCCHLPSLFCRVSVRGLVASISWISRPLQVCCATSVSGFSCAKTKLAYLEPFRVYRSSTCYHCQMSRRIFLWKMHLYVHKWRCGCIYQTWLESSYELRFSNKFLVYSSAVIQSNVCSPKKCLKKPRDAGTE